MLVKRVAATERDYWHLFPNNLIIMNNFYEIWLKKKTNISIARFMGFLGIFRHQCKCLSCHNEFTQKLSTAWRPMASSSWPNVAYIHRKNGHISTVKHTCIAVPNFPLLSWKWSQIYARVQSGFIKIAQYAPWNLHTLLLFFVLLCLILEVWR